MGRRPKALGTIGVDRAFRSLGTTPGELADRLGADPEAMCLGCCPATRPGTIGGTEDGMKTSNQCPKCHSLTVGYIPVSYDRVAYPEGDYVAQRVGAVVTRREIDGIEVTERIGVGHYETYFCAECGYSESYVADPGSLPFDKMEGFLWLNPEARRSGPYR